MAGPWVAKPTERQEWVVDAGARLLSRIDRWMMRWTKGNTRWRFLGRGLPALLLTTTGRKSGKPRTTPVLYIRDGDTFVVGASKGGMPHHPLWYLNLEANADAEVEIEGCKIPVLARRATETERKRLWSKLVDLYSGFATYQERTSREIPVVILSPKRPKEYE